MPLLDRFKKPKETETPAQKPSVPAKQEAEAPKPKAAKPKKEKKAKQGTKKSTKKEASTKKTPVSPHAAALSRLISKPLITEKATILAETGTYVFFVDTSANKIEIKQAIRAVYGVTPKAIRIANQQGKVVRFGRYKGQRMDRKKAYVTLKKGDSIDYSA